MTFTSGLRRTLVGALCLGSPLLLLPLGPSIVQAQATVVKPMGAKVTALASTHSKNVHVGTLNAVDDQAVHVTLADGTALDAELRPSSLFFLNGLAVPATDFKPGAKVVLRTRTRASDGTVSVVLMSDPATAAAIDAYRRKPLIGHVVSTDDKSLVVQPEGIGVLPLTLHVTAKTVYHKRGADAGAAAFPAGAPVAVVTRGLPSGLLMASIVSDTSTDAVAEKAALKPVSLVGLADSVLPDQNLLTIIPKTKPRQTIAVVDATKIKVQRAAATLREILPGMRVSARLGHQKDDAGHIIATSLSAYPVLPRVHKKVSPRIEIRG